MNAPPSYRRGREIARGGMGVVLDARDQKLGRSVAMKVMLRRQASEEEEQRFLQEARVLGQLAHPNIVPVHDVGRDEQGRFFYTMKLVQGMTLHEVIGRLKAGDKEMLAKYPLPTLLTIFQKVCDAVGFAHSRGIIHRDLKPHNIMVGEFGEVLVMDWGLAKILPGSPAAEEAARAQVWAGAGGEASSKAALIGGSRSGGVASAATGSADGATLPSAGAVGGNEEVTRLTGGVEPDLDATLASDAPKVVVEAGGVTPGSSAIVAAAGSSGSYATLEGAVMGTPQYMSPEQAEGRVGELDARSDIFSLGGILYALLALRPPVEGGDTEELLAKVKRGEITPPSAFGVGSSPQLNHRKPGGAVVAPRQIVPLPHLPGGRVPGALSAVTMKALAVRREDRYPAVAALSADLTAYQGGFATSAENASLLTLVRLFIHRHKALSAAVSLIVVLTIGFMGKVVSSERKATQSAASALAEAGRARAAEERARQNERGMRGAFAQAAVALADAALREANGLAMQAALDGVPADLRDATWHYLRSQADTSIAKVGWDSRIERVAAHPRRPGVFAIADASGKVVVLEARTGVRRLTFEPAFGGKDSLSLRLAFSPDGERIAVGREGAGGLVIHSASDGKRLLGWPAPATAHVEFSPDGRQLLQTVPTEEGNKRLSMWDATDGRRAWEYVPSQEFDYTHGVFTPDGRQVVTASFADSFRVVNARDGALIRSFRGGRDVITALAMGSDGVAVAGDRRGFVIRIDLNDGRVMSEFRAHNDVIEFLALTADAEQIVTAIALPDGRQAIQCWQAGTGERMRPLLGGSGEISGISLHPGSGELFVAGPDSRVWSVAGTPARWLLPKSGRVTSIAFWGGEEKVFAPLPSLEVALQRLETNALSMLWKPKEGGFHLLNVSADGRTAAVGAAGSPSSVAWMRNPGATTEVVRSVVLTNAPDYLRLSPTGDRLAVVGLQQGAVEVIDLGTGVQRVALERAGIVKFNDLGWVGGGRQLVALVTMNAERGAPGSEERIVLWEVETGRILRTAMQRTAMEVLGVAPNGGRFAEAGADKIVRIRDAETLVVQREFRAHDGPITAVVWHPSKPVIATASADLSVRIWDVEGGRQLEELRGPLGPPAQVVFSPSGRRIACTTARDVGRIWEPESLQ